MIFFVHSGIKRVTTACFWLKENIIETEQLQEKFKLFFLEHLRDCRWDEYQERRFGNLKL